MLFFLLSLSRGSDVVNAAGSWGWHLQPCSSRITVGPVHPADMIMLLLLPTLWACTDAGESASDSVSHITHYFTACHWLLFQWEGALWCGLCLLSGGLLVLSAAITHHLVAVDVLALDVYCIYHSMINNILYLAGSIWCSKLMLHPGTQ